MGLLGRVGFILTDMAPLVLTVAAFKGGVGKTTVVANVATSWAFQHPELRGLVVDLDYQGNLTQAFSSLVTSQGDTSSGVLLDSLATDPSASVDTSQFSRIDFGNGIGLDLLQADDSLNRVEERLTTLPGGERLLSRLFSHLDYDFIVVDTRPTNGRLTWNAVCASTHVVAVVNPSSWSASGAVLVHTFVQQAQDFGLSNAVFLGSVVNRVEGGRRLVRDQVLSDLQDVGAVLLEPAIPARASVGVAEYLGVPVVVGDVSSPTAVALSELSNRMWEMVA
jgi:chromosome partitioning protein